MPMNVKTLSHDDIAFPCAYRRKKFYLCFYYASNSSDGGYIVSQKGGGMRRLLQVGGFLFGIVFWVALAPAFAGGTKIGVVDVQKIMRESAVARDARGMFLLDVEAKRAVLRSKEKEVHNMKKAPGTQGSNPSSTGGKEKREKFDREVKDLRHLRDDMEEELKKKEAELRLKLLCEIREAAKAYLQKEKYSIIFEKKALFVFDEAVDVTDEIIAFYDAKKEELQR
jgi:outer membrane protein